MKKKITVEKNEGVAEIIDRVLTGQNNDEEVVVVVPKGSLLAKSARNFSILKREAEDAGIAVSVESVDDEILALAAEAGITAAHPFWKNQGMGSVSDIVPGTHHESDDEEVRTAKEVKAGAQKKASVIMRRKIVVPAQVVETEEEEDGSTAEEEEESGEIVSAKEGASSEGTRFFGGQNRFFKERAISEDEEDSDDSRFSWKWAGIIVSVIVIVGLAAWGVTALFGHVTVTINFKKMPWADQASFTAEKSASVIDPANDILPAQVFTLSKNTTQLFPASSQENVSIKAQGVLTIYNAYSSAPQTLVATTRFVTPAGQIFRLMNQVIVPGAQVTNGQIVPSSINTPVVADQAGPSYDIGPVAKLTVPGFANTAKFAGFYGSLASSTSGGFTGEKAVPTAADVTNAEAKVTSLLESQLQGGLAGTYPNNFTILDGATNVSVAKLAVNTSTDANGDFSVFGEATLSAIGFDGTAFKAFLLSLAQATEPSSTFSDLTLNFADVAPNFTNGTLAFSVSAQGDLEPAFSSSTFVNSIVGQNISSARLAVASLPQLDNGSISVWPSWLWTIPSNSGKVHVNVD